MPLPLLTAHLPGTGGRIRSEDDDFVVEELPAYAPLGVGDHSYLRIEKRGITTYEAIRRVAVALGVSPKAIGFAGMKDAHAVTSQVMSVHRVPPGRVLALRRPNVRVLWAERHPTRGLCFRSVEGRHPNPCP